MGQFLMTRMLLTFVIALRLKVHCDKLLSVGEAYKNGVKAYEGERWSECIAQFEDAIHFYKLYKSTIINCRLQCSTQKYDQLIKEHLQDLRYYEKIFNTRKCLLECQNKGFKDLKLENYASDSTVQNMEWKKPYEYLHMCYFEMNMLPKAASAAYTYLLAHPGDRKMTDNLEYYVDQQEVDKNHVVDLENDDYKVLYKISMTAYQKQNWGEAVAALEETLADYFASEDRCRVECENQPPQEWSPEISITLSNHIASLLQCRQQCQLKLKFIRYNSGVEFLADMLNYLQMSYYHLGRFDDAAKAVTTYLAILPADEDMLENLKIYRGLVKEDLFVELSDIIFYLKRDKYEKNLLNVFYHENNLISNSI